MITVICFNDADGQLQALALHDDEDDQNPHYSFGACSSGMKEQMCQLECWELAYWRRILFVEEAP